MAKLEDLVGSGLNVVLMCHYFPHPVTVANIASSHCFKIYFKFVIVGDINVLGFF